MNSMIDSLFDQYDRGRMTRRNLVSSSVGTRIRSHQFSSPNASDSTRLWARILASYTHSGNSELYSLATSRACFSQNSIEWLILKFPNLGLMSTA